MLPLPIEISINDVITNDLKIKKMFNRFYYYEIVFFLSPQKLNAMRFVILRDWYSL